MYDPISLVWLINWTVLGSYGLFLLLIENSKASCFYVYGKSLDSSKKKGFLWQLFLLPKRYFVHFYLSATLIFLTSLATIFIYYVPSDLSNQLSELFAYIIKLQNDHAIKLEVASSLTSITALIFTLILMLIQSTRRLYETLFISVFSEQSKINIIHYLFGHFFYAAAAASTTFPILLSNTSSKYTFTDLIDNLVTKQRALAFVLFIYASHCQHKCNKILANLRKDKTGRVITQQHYVPSGGLFEYVSCPHFLAEVVIYFLILVAQEFSISYWNLIFLLVLSTQTITAITEHRWYKRKYADYPKERKAIIPMLL